MVGHESLLNQGAIVTLALFGERQRRAQLADLLIGGGDFLLA